MKAQVHNPRATSELQPATLRLFEPLQPSDRSNESLTQRPEAAVVLPFVEKLHCKSCFGSGQAVEGLVKLGSLAVPFLIEALRSSDAQVRCGAAEALGRLEAEASVAVPSLLQNLKDQNPKARLATVYAIGSIAERDNAVTAALKACLLRDEDAHLRAEAAFALAQTNADAAEVVPALIEALSDVALGVRAGAARVLGQYGQSAIKAIPRLIQVMEAEDENEYVCAVAAQSLGQMGESGRLALPVLNRIYFSTNSGRVRSAAGSALEAFGVLNGCSPQNGNTPHRNGAPPSALTKSRKKADNGDRPGRSSFRHEADMPEQITHPRNGRHEQRSSPWADVDIGSAIREVRSMLGVSQKELTKKAGLTISFLSMLENGRCGVSLKVVDKFAAILQVRTSLIMILGMKSQLGAGKVDASLEVLQRSVREELAARNRGRTHSQAGR